MPRRTADGHLRFICLPLRPLLQPKTQHRGETMYAQIRIGDKDVGMLANAASSYIYKQVFHEDLLKKFQDMGAEPDTQIGEKMGFIFAKQAEVQNPSELMKLTMDDFLEWLTQFDPLDIFLESDKIAELYQRQKEGSSVPKEQGE